MNPEIIGAAFLVLLALGSVAQGLVTLADPLDSGGASPGGVGLSATALNLVADSTAAAYLIYGVAKDYYTKANGVVSRGPAAEPACGSFITGALFFIEGLTLMAGFGVPYAGEDLKEGGRRLAEVGEQLDLVLPDSAWRGLSSQAYADRIMQAQSDLWAIGSIDKDLAGTAEEIAEFVNAVRLIFGILKSLLILANLIERRLYASSDFDSIEFAQYFAPRIAIAATLCAVALVIAVQGVSLHVKSYSLLPYADDYADCYVNSMAGSLHSFR